MTNSRSYDILHDQFTTDFRVICSRKMKPNSILKIITPEFFIVQI